MNVNQWRQGVYTVGSNTTGHYIVSLSNLCISVYTVQVHANIQSSQIKSQLLDCLSSKNVNYIKGLVHPKMKILSVFTHPHVVPTP